MAKKEPTYTWNQETGEATYTIYYKDLTFTGKATCHPDDEDMKSQLMGLTIAERRALISYMSHVLNNELKPKLAAYKQLYYNMKHSKKFNPKGYEAKMIYRQIEIFEDDIFHVRETINSHKFSLREYLRGKEELHQTLREKRKAKSDQENTSEN